MCFAEMQTHWDHHAPTTYCMQLYKIIANKIILRKLSTKKIIYPNPYFALYLRVHALLMILINYSHKP